MTADSLLIVVVNLFNVTKMPGPEATETSAASSYTLSTQKRKFGAIVDLREKLHQILSEFAGSISATTEQYS